MPPPETMGQTKTGSMAEVENDDNIALYTAAEVNGLAGGPGNFKVSILQKSKGVDPEKCLKCGRCTSVCPTEVPSEFEEGMYPRKAAYLPFPQAVPSSYVIDFENCTRCGSCVEACPAEAISMGDDEKAKVDEEECVDCEVCVDECPNTAISMSE